MDWQMLANVRISEDTVEKLQFFGHSAEECLKKLFEAYWVKDVLEINLINKGF